MIDSSDLLKCLPNTLRADLLSRYQAVMSNYLEHRWEPSELNAGKFCETVYTIVVGALAGSYPPAVRKPRNMLAACRQLEQTPADPSRVGDHSLRILIPRTLTALYDIRNNRGVGHVGGDVDPNHMDAEAVQAMCSWVMAELVRIFHTVSTEEAQRTVDALVERKSPIIWEVEVVRRVLDPSMKARDQTLLLLYHCNEAISAARICSWVEYSNLAVFRKQVLLALHRERLIEYNRGEDRVRISPLGSRRVEDTLLSYD